MMTVSYPPATGPWAGMPMINHPQFHETPEPSNNTVINNLNINLNSPCAGSQAVASAGAGGAQAFASAGPGGAAAFASAGPGFGGMGANGLGLSQGGMVGGLNSAFGGGGCPGSGGAQKSELAQVVAVLLRLLGGAGGGGRAC